jgi:glycosyltransferase 2 family protein
MLGLAALTAIAIAGAPFILLRSGAHPSLMVPVLALGAVLAASAGLLLFDRFEGPLAALLRWLSFGAAPPWMYRMLEAGAWAARSTRLMLIAWPGGALTLIISLLNQLLIGYVAFLLLAAMGDSVGLGWVLVLFPAVLLLSMLPISLGGWGVRESAMVVAFALVGVPADAALATSILYGLCLLAASLPGGLVWLTERRASAELRRIDPND